MVSDGQWWMGGSRRMTPAEWVAVMILLAIYCGLAASSMVLKGNAFDEMSHLTAGVSYWLTGDFRLNSEQGLLPQAWAALPVHLARFPFPSLDQPWWWISNEWALGQQFFFEIGNNLERMLLLGRVMIVCLGVGLGCIVYGWSRRLFGPAGGLLSLAIYGLSPTILAHTQLVTSDASIALTMTASLAACWMMLHRLTLPTAILHGVVAAALFLSKASAVVYPLMVLLLVLIRLTGGRPLRVGLWKPIHRVTDWRSQAWMIGPLLVLQVLVVWGMIWGAYGFRYEAMRDPTPGRDRLYAPWEQLLADSSASTRSIGWLRDKRLLPEAYLWGLAFHNQTARQDRIGFLNGQYSMEGWWSFFPYCFLVKTPLPVFALLGLSGLGTALQWRHASHSTWRRRLRGLYATAPLWVLLVVYWATVLTTRLNIGHRHLLLTYPAVFILAGGAAVWLRLAPRCGPPLLASLLVWFGATNFLIWPNYLAYFNVLAGGPTGGYRHLVDSSIDWGQDLPALSRYLRRHGLDDAGHLPIYLQYFGSADPRYYGIDARLLPGVWGPSKPSASSEPLEAGIYFISVTQLQGVYSVPAIGPWCEPYEQQYQFYRELARQHRQATSEPDPARRRQMLERYTSAQWDAHLMMWQELRAARLCAYLRQQRPHPDDQVDYSIHRYNLSESEIRQAVDGPPPTPYHPSPQIVGQYP